MKIFWSICHWSKQKKLENLQVLLTISQIYLEFGIIEKEYYKALSLWKDDDFELRSIRPPISCFVNNWFEHGFEAWQDNIDVHPVFNKCKAAIFICSYFSKTEDQCPMTEAAKEAFKQNLEQFETMKSIVKAYISSRVFRFSTGSSVACSSRTNTTNIISSSMLCKYISTRGWGRRDNFTPPTPSRPLPFWVNAETAKAVTLPFCSI